VAVTVIGGGMAKACSAVALDGAADRKSEETCTTALDTELLSPRDRAGTYVNRGIIKLRRTEWTSAKHDFDRAVGLKPDLGEIYINRGAALIGMRRYQEGLSDLNRALTLGVDETEKAYFNRALAYEGLDDMRSAYLDYQKALELKPDWDVPKRELSRFTVTRR
jgi:tetratricopeptide (TPR) repeat protein